MNTSICAAIQSRAVLRFSYGGGARTAEPHCHGISRADNEVLRAWQTGGFSESGNPEGWKLFEVSQITGLSRTDSTFSSNRPGYNPSDKHMKSVHCHV
jgi:hypothetical protein